jgi:signal transduction histidine kinase/ligand-binding sensor domain-containing protein/DNA-binding response OmpR family regulator
MAKASRTVALFWVAILSLPVGAVHASTVGRLPDAPGFVHEVFTAADGLPAAGIAQMLQTRDGFLWLATFDGLVRFDGARFETFDSERLPALGSNRIFNLAEGRDGALWARTEQGHLVRFANGVFTACPAPTAGRADCSLQEAGAPVYTLLQADRTGALWAGGPGGVFRVEGSGLREDPGLKVPAAVQSVFLDRAGGLWVGTRDALWRRGGGSERGLERIALPPGRFPLDFPTVAVDDAGETWIGAPDAVGKLRGGAFLPVLPGKGTVGEDPRGGIWIAFPDRLIHVRGSDRREVWSEPASPLLMNPLHGIRIGPGGDVWAGVSKTLTHDGRTALRLSSEVGGISAVTLGRDGTVWVATMRRGELHALRPARVTTFAEGLPSPIVYPIYEDHQGTIWAGGLDFLAALTPGAERFRSFPNPAGPGQSVYAFLRDRAGTFWVGTSRGLYTLGADGFKPAGDERNRNLAAAAIFEDSAGGLWVGTENGLFHREPLAQGGRWTWLRPENGLPFPWIRVIRQTPDGALWIGTNGGGVIRLAGGRFTAATHAQGLASDLVRSIYLAPDGRLWIGTENRGLSRLDPTSIGRPEGPRIALVGTRQGLPSRGVHQIVADGLGNLWMSSNDGIFRARLEDLNAVADGRLPRLETVVYTERDGMAVREANGSVQDAGLRDRQGRIWFPTQAGVVRLDPRRLLRPTPPPPVYIEGLRLGEEESPVGPALRLLPPRRSFALEFTAPSFLAPERQRFRFRLAPYDRDWIDAGSRREASFTQVPPGRYRFEVKAAGPDGGWSPPATLPIEVVPRFYETGWFQALCAALAAAAVFGLVRAWDARQRAGRQQLARLVAERTATIARQAEKLRELDDLKSQFFANVSHELRTPLTLTLGPLQDALDGRFGPLSEDLADQIQVALSNAQRLLGLVDQLLDVARLSAGRLRLRLRRGDAAAAVRLRVEAFLPLAERRGIELSLAAPAEPVAAWFDEVQIEKVFDNLLGNALKFTPRGGGVEVTVAPVTAAVPPGDEPVDLVEIGVRDNGPGIPADQLDRIFERFYQVEATTERRWPGAGIGLALARQLAELHGGALTVESAEGEGARFTVTLRRDRAQLPAAFLDEILDETRDEAPRQRERRPAGIPALPSETPDEPMRPHGLEDFDRETDRTTVLVVDDHPDVRAYVRRHLEPDYRVVEAADGAEGLKQARRFVPDLVISDVMMPGMDGSALLRALREDPELEFIPVVLLTAKASAESRVQGFREGVDDYLVKPFDPRELKARADNLIASRKRLLARFETRPARPLRVSEVNVTSADEAFLARVQATVEERLGDSDLTVEGLAEALACDRSYLLRKLRALNGETPSGLIRSFRLQRAEQLLRARAGAVSEVAYAVGFKSVAHFSNAFQERYGERPSAFAARHRGR